MRVRLLRGLRKPWMLLFLSGFLFFSMLVGVGRAEDTPEHVSEPAIVNSVPNAWEEIKAVVDVLAPTAELVYEFQDQQWSAGLAGSLYEFTSNDFRLGRVKLGYLSTNSIYGGADVDLPGLVVRYLGGRWGQLDTVLGVVSRYATTGYILGYDWNDGEIVHGFSLGATVRF